MNIAHSSHCSNHAEPFHANKTGDVTGMLRKRLPAPLFSLLRQTGERAGRMGFSAYVVGGFVRDLLLGIKNFDIDVVIEGDGIAFARALARHRHGKVQTHERFGTATVIFPNSYKIDIATARKESYEDVAALPMVEHSTITEDLYRRDFTINTLAVRINRRGFGQLIDLCDGQRDLKGKSLRVLHRMSFVDDPTRVFRAIRLAQRLGFRIHKDTLVLIQDAVCRKLFARLSGHRLREELILLLSEERPRLALAHMAQIGLLRSIHPKLRWSPRLAALLKRVEDALRRYQRYYPGRRIEPWLVYFIAVLDPLPSQAVSLTMARLAVPQRYAEQIRVARSKVPGLIKRLAQRPPLEPAETYRLLHNLSDEALLYLLAKTTSSAVKQQVFAHLTTYQHVTLSVTGDDLKRMGLKPGPLFKKILGRVMNARLNGQVNSARQERQMARTLAEL